MPSPHSYHEPSPNLWTDVWLAALAISLDMSSQPSIADSSHFGGCSCAYSRCLTVDALKVNQRGTTDRSGSPQSRRTARRSSYLKRTRRELFASEPLHRGGSEPRLQTRRAQ